MDTKDAVLQPLYDEFDELDALLSSLTEAQWELPSILPGWRVHDIVSHICGTELALLGDPLPTADANRSSRAHVRNPIGDFNEGWVDQLGAHTAEHMLRLFRETVERRRYMLDAMEPAQWEMPTPSPIGVVPYGVFMLVRHFDCWIHELDIRDSVGQPGFEGGEHGELAYAQLLRGIGRAVGKQAAAPKGSRITFELSGDLPKTLHVAVDDRATIVPELDEVATVTIGLDFGQFIRGCCGRATFDPAAAETVGDHELGIRILNNLGATI